MADSVKPGRIVAGGMGSVLLLMWGASKLGMARWQKAIAVGFVGGAVGGLTVMKHPNVGAGILTGTGGVTAWELGGEIRARVLAAGTANPLTLPAQANAGATQGAGAGAGGSGALPPAGGTGGGSAGTGAGTQPVQQPATSGG